MDDFAIKTELRIDWSEIDLFGHVNNLSIMKYAQASRIKLLDRVGLMQLQYDVKKGPILASISTQFRKALFYPGKVTVYSKVSVIKNTSFEIQHVIFDEQNEIAAQVKDIIVYFDFTDNTKLSIPVDLREKLLKMERN